MKRSVVCEIVGTHLHKFKVFADEPADFEALADAIADAIVLRDLDDVDADALSEIWEDERELNAPRDSGDEAPE